MTKKIYYFTAALFLILCAAFSINGALKNAPTCDEIAHHVPEGYSYLLTGDFRLNPSNPPLTREISAIPLLFMKLKAPFDTQLWQAASNVEFGKKFFYEYNKNADSIIFWARMPSVILSLLLGTFVFIWASILFGRIAGLFALFLYSFSPNILAHSSLAGNDLGLTVFMFLTIFSFWLYLKKPSKARLTVTAITFGLALGSKYPAVILFPILILMAIANEYKNKNRTVNCINYLLCIFIIGIILLWGLYFFELKPLLKNAPDIPEKIEFVNKFYAKYIPEFLIGTKEGLLKFMNKFPLPLTTYIVGFFGSHISRRARRSLAILAGQLVNSWLVVLLPCSIFDQDAASALDIYPLRRFIL